MDPNIALVEFLNACVASDATSALESIDALTNWIARGGSLPEVQRTVPGQLIHQVDQAQMGRVFVIPWKPG